MLGIEWRYLLATLLFVVVPAIAVIVALVIVVTFVVRKRSGSQQMMRGTKPGSCGTCGHALPERADFCSKCGAAVNTTLREKN
jgi:hypothetical protein